MSDKTELDIEAERVSFEAQLALDDYRPLRRNSETGNYSSVVVETCWQIWLAARRATIQPTAEPKTPLDIAIDEDARNFDASRKEPPKRVASHDYPWGWRYADEATQQAFQRFCQNRAAAVAPADAVRDARDLDTARLDWLSAAVEDGCVTSCFEMDGGIHLTLDPAGDEQKAYRNMNDLREAIDAARRSTTPKEPEK